MTQSNIFSLPDFKFNLFEDLPPTLQNKNDLVVLGERIYKLNKSKCKFISTGLSYDMCYTPCVKMSGNKNDVIVFDENEWAQFITNESIITNYLYSNDKVEPIRAGSFSIYFEQISASRVIKIWKNNSHVYLGFESICKLWELLPLVKYRVDMIKRLQFANYFKIVQKGLQRQGGNVFENVKNLLPPSENSNSENFGMLMELMYIYPDVFETECCSKV